MHVAGATVAGSPDTPNEDWFATTPELVVVLDGATVRTETGCHHGAAWYAARLGGAILAHAANLTTSLELVLAQSIRDVAAQHADTCNLTHPGTPSAGVAIARVEGDTLRYLVLGDVTVVLDVDGWVDAISDHRISAAAAAERAEVDRYLIGTEEKRAALLAMKHAELAARNREYWVAAADPAAAEHAITGEVDLADLRRLAVLTDGAARWVDMFRQGGWETVLRMCATRGPQWVIDTMVRQIEENDPRGARHPRNKPSDDATAVYAVPRQPPPQPSRVTPESRRRVLAEWARRVDESKLYGDRIKERQAARR